jgi:hypothetical protein
MIRPDQMTRNIDQEAEIQQRCRNLQANFAAESSIIRQAEAPDGHACFLGYIPQEAYIAADTCYFGFRLTKVWAF